MNLDLAGKAAYVTGGAHGIGAGIARYLAEEGADVFISDLNVEALNLKRDEWEGSSVEIGRVVTDLSSADGVRGANEAVLQHFGRAPDYLVNNVGVAVTVPFTEITDEQWLGTFNLNLMSYVRTSRALVPLMAERPGSAVVNLASDVAKQPEIMPVDYGSMKAAILFLTKALSLEFAPAVRTNAVLPGPVWSRLWTRPGGAIDGLKQLYKTDDADTAVNEYLKDRQLTFGISQPEDIAALVAFVLSPRAKQINGAAFDIGGTVRSLY